MQVDICALFFTSPAYIRLHRTIPFHCPVPRGWVSGFSAVKPVPNLFRGHPFSENPGPGTRSSLSPARSTIRVLNAMPGAPIEFPGNKAYHQERLITFMEISETGKPEDRIAALEKKTAEMEALVKGLVDEMLDFKALAQTMAKKAGEQRPQEPARGHVVVSTAPQAPESPATSPTVAAPQENRTVIRPKSASPPEVTAEPEPEMVRIMQTDGTMKMEVRRGDKNPRDSTGSGRRK